MDLCARVGGGLCVLWVASGIIFSIFEVVLECPEKLSLSILAQRPHKELFPHEPVRPGEKKKKKSLKDIGQLRVRLWSRESDSSSPRCRAG